MDFKIDMSKVVKIVVAKDDDSFIEYKIDNGTIVDVSIVGKETTFEDKVNNLKKNNEDFKKISKLIEFDKAGILNKMVKSGQKRVFGAIKESIINEPIETDTVQEVKEASNEINDEILADNIKDASKIMKLDEKMDEIAKANREEIAERIFDDEVNGAFHNNKGKKFKWEQPDFSKISKTADRTKRIENLKGMITNINKNKKKR